MVSNNFVWMGGGIEQRFGPFLDGSALNEGGLDLFFKLLCCGG